MQISRNVDRVTVGDEGSIGPPNIYFVTGSTGAAFVDTGYGNDTEVEECLALWADKGNPPVAAIVLTHRHPDHVGGASRLRTATGGRVLCTEVERGPVEDENTTVDSTVSDGDTLALGGVTLEFVATPGHTMGSLCVLLREDGLLFTGDTVLGGGSVAISPDHGDVGCYVGSLAKLIGIGSRLIAPGHGPVVDEPLTKLKWLIEHRRKREEQIIGLLSSGTSSMDGLFNEIYPKLGTDLHRTARGQIRAHLMKLERDGKLISAEPSNGPYLLRRNS